MHTSRPGLRPVCLLTRLRRAPPGPGRPPRIEEPTPRICHGMSCFVMGPVYAPAVRKALQPPCRSAVPDAPPPEERSSRAHNARPVARARPPARGGGTLPSTVDVMICHEDAVRCHEMSCSVMRAAGNVMFCHAGPLPPGCRRVLPAGLRRGFRRRGSVSVMRASFQAKGGTVSLFRAPLRGRARGAAGGRIAAARLARLIARARRQTHLARPFPPGVFSRPPAIAFCRKAERRPRKPPLSTFILHHTAKCQAHTGTKNENTGDFSWNAGGTGQQRPGHRGGGEGHATQSHRNRMCGAGSPPGRVRLQSRRVIRPSTAGETVPEASTYSIAWAAIREASLVSRRRSASSNMA